MGQSNGKRTVIVLGIGVAALLWAYSTALADVPEPTVSPGADHISSTAAYEIVTSSELQSYAVRDSSMGGCMATRQINDNNPVPEHSVGILVILLLGGIAFGFLYQRDSID
ncbi:MAG: hypothetical protein CMH54_10870 [Myxococcales bacterium]|nr:hypothetical protein [Myxococcales bacterium]